jgi:hypothetical protein
LSPPFFFDLILGRRKIDFPVGAGLSPFVFCAKTGELIKAIATAAKTAVLAHLIWRKPVLREILILYNKLR